MGQSLLQSLDLLLFNSELVQSSNGCTDNHCFRNKSCSLVPAYLHNKRNIRCSNPFFCCCVLWHSLLSSFLRMMFIWVCLIVFTWSGWFFSAQQSKRNIRHVSILISSKLYNWDMVTSTFKLTFDTDTNQEYLRLRKVTKTEIDAYHKQFCRNLQENPN